MTNCTNCYLAKEIMDKDKIQPDSYVCPECGDIDYIQEQTDQAIQIGKRVIYTKQEWPTVICANPTEA